MALTVQVNKIIALFICTVACGRIVTCTYICRCNNLTKTLNCSSHSLTNFRDTDIPPDCSAYMKIYLSNNKFENIPYGDIRTFDHVNVSRNNITEVNSSVGLSVTVLDASFNSIRQIRLGKAFRKLRALCVAHNKLNEAPGKFVEDTCEISHLDVSYNKLRSLRPVSICSNLTRLDASHNCIQVVPDTFEKLVKLSIMDLSDNVLEHLSHLPESVKVLDLSGNRLREITESAFEGLQKLEEVNLARNSITRVAGDALGAAPALQRVDLRGNGLRAVPPPLLLGVALREASPGAGRAARRLDLRANPLSARDAGLRALLRRLAAGGATVEASPDCACANATRGAAALLVCVVDAGGCPWPWHNGSARGTATPENVTSAARDATCELNAGATPEAWMSAMLCLLALLCFLAVASWTFYAYYFIKTERQRRGIVKTVSNVQSEEVHPSAQSKFPSAELRNVPDVTIEC